MSADDWFRKKTWTDTDRTEFLARLARSRSTSNKVEYARIQAIELHRCGGRHHTMAALELLDMILGQWRSEGLMLASVHAVRANCLRDLEDDAGALAAYRATFDQQRRVPNVITNAHLDFAWWVSVRRREDLFEECLATLDEFSSELKWPVAVYMSEAARALIQDARGDRVGAARHAREAMEAAEARHSGLRYHATIGLVTNPDKKVLAQLKRLAAR